VINGRFLSQPLSGVQRYAIQICLALKELGVNVQIVAPKSAASHPLAGVFKPTFTGKTSGHLWEQTELVAYLRRHKSPPLLNLCNTAPLFYSNQVVTFHDLAFMRCPKWFSKKFQLLYRFLIPQLAKRSRHILTVSEFSKSEIIQLLHQSPSKISVVRNAATDLGALGSTNEQKFNFQSQDYILALSSINPRKNLATLLDAHAQLIQRHKIPLVIVGEAARSYANCNDINSAMQNCNIIHIPRVDDDELASLYKKAKLFVYPSLYEGFGLPPLEALYYGCLPLVSDIPPHREVCQDQAIYFDPLSAEDLLKGFEKGLNTASNVAAMKKYARSFSWIASARSLVRTIEQLNINPQIKEKA